MTSTYMHHQKWKKNLPPNYIFDDRASLSTVEAEQLSEFYKSRYLYYVQQKMRCTLDYEDLAVKSIDVYDVDYGMRDCKKVYDKLRAKLKDTKDSNIVLETVVEQSTGFKQVDDNQKNVKSNEVPNQINSVRTSKENATFFSDSELHYLSNVEELDWETRAEVKKLLNEKEMQKERNELVQLVQRITSNAKGENNNEKSEEKISDGEIPETPVTNNPNRENNKIKNLNIEVKKEAKELVKTESQD